MQTPADAFLFKQNDQSGLLDCEKIEVNTPIDFLFIISMLSAPEPYKSVTRTRGRASDKNLTKIEPPTTRDLASGASPREAMSSYRESRHLSESH
jgi:hypothetical protein